MNNERGQVFIGITLSLLLIVTLQFAHAQEKPAREMRQWQVGWLPLIDAAHEGQIRVDVIDTEGVCLYLAHGERRERTTAQNTLSLSEKDVALAMTQAVSLAAVPKTQLPKGAGCQ